MKKFKNWKGEIFTASIPGIKLAEVNIVYRKKGIKNEGHFHKGKDKGKDPEYVFMVQGKMHLRIEDRLNNTKEYVVTKGDCLIIPKNLFHQYDVLEDSVFLEPNPEKFNMINRDVLFYEDFINS